MTTFETTWHECEDIADLGYYFDAIRRAGGKVRRSAIDEVEGVAKITIQTEDRRKFFLSLIDTEMGCFCNQYQ